MASSSGNSNSNSISGSGSPVSTQLQNSGSEGNLVLQIDQRKRKRMQSNRESARRSRMRKQQHLDELVGEVSELKKENNQILSNINITTQHYMKVEAENSILRAQMMELSQRLDSLNEILAFINNTNSSTCENDQGFEPIIDGIMNPLNMPYINQPIMASADMFDQY